MEKTKMELIEENEMLLSALKRVNKAINNMKLNDRFGHTQQYVKEAIDKASGADELIG